MKHLIFFLFLIPAAAAIAVTPSSLDFGEVNSTATKELTVYNNLEYSAIYSITGEALLKSEPGQASLEPEEYQTFKITISPQTIGTAKTYAYADELQEGANVINTIAIPIHYNCTSESTSDYSDKGLPEISVDSMFRVNFNSKRNYAYAAFALIPLLLLIARKKTIYRLMRNIKREPNRKSTPTTNLNENPPAPSKTE